MELWINILIVVSLLLLSALCSGLNIGLMSLDIADLERKAKSENTAAKRVLSLRKNSHLSLASILLTNVAVISAISLLLEQKMNGILAGVISTLLIVVLAEIIPQALFVQHALNFCSRFAPLLRVMIFVTYPIAKLLQLLLDKLFGRQKALLHSRSELGIILAEHATHEDSELDEDEVEIMRGALSLSEKRVRDIMTDITKVFWLTPDSVLSSEKIDEIKAGGWSRMPVLNQEQTECYGVLLLKDLVDINFDNHQYHVRDFPLHKTKLIGSMTALDTMFRKFINSRTHLMPVERDDKIVGIITVEDLIEEIIGHEIEDEKDI